MSDSAKKMDRSSFVFQCQLAQGSPTGLVTGFSTVKELYAKISLCYDLPVDDILYCTLNTHKVDMSRLLGGQIGLDDFIFVHQKGRAKEIDITKSEEALGLTITDNAAGYAFIKKIKEDSVLGRIPFIKVGDHIERVNEENVVGKKHFEVAKVLKEIPLHSAFNLRLIEPLKSGFSNIEQRSNSKKWKTLNQGSGKETIRLKADGTFSMSETVDQMTQKGIERLNRLLESYLGISDLELATQIWEKAEDKDNSLELAEAIDNSDLEELRFTDDFIIEVWGIVTDIRSRRIS